MSPIYNDLPNKVIIDSSDENKVIIEDQSNKVIVANSGAQGATGPGVIAGGVAGQLLAKIDSTDYNTEWIDNYANWTSQLKHEVKLGEAIDKGQAVYVSSADGTNMIVSKASNTSEGTSSKTMGLLETGGALNAKVKVITEGLLSGLNTASANAGDPVWLGTSGNLIYGLLNKPYAPAHLVFIGIVTRSNINNGEIFVKVQNGFELKEIHDVDLLTTLPVEKDLLVYENSTSLWKNKTFSNLGLAKTDAANAFTVGGHTIANDAIGTIPLSVKAIASQTANLQTWTDSASAVLAQVTAGGSIASGANGTFGTLTSLARLTVVNGTASVIGAVIRGDASQTADLQQWQLGDAAVRSSVSANGRFAIRSATLADAAASLFVGAVNTTDKPIVVRGAASQSANLQEWQNSAGTIVANMQAGGNLKASNVATLNSLAQLAQANSGGVMIMGRATAKYSSPGANSAALYFRDGTTAGTLKLVVRAGAAGAETTILDNIPQ
jgi:hypothetical protein